METPRYWRCQSRETSTTESCIHIVEPAQERDYVAGSKARRSEPSKNFETKVPDIRHEGFDVCPIGFNLALVLYFHTMSLFLYFEIIMYILYLCILKYVIRFLVLLKVTIKRLS